jgi:H/ACA ribonucleoprotein complex subunit 4
MEIDLEKIKTKKMIKELIEFSIINVDKPSGPTSFWVDNFIKKNLNLTKTSHFGTLDPMVTGVLPVALGRACRLSGYFMGKDKEYIGVMRIHEKISIEKLKEGMKKFTGKIKQLPPVKSRVKREERIREVKKFEILEISEDEQDILFVANVQAGTYIRKLIHDLGEHLGIGAHMTELRRTRASIFTEKDENFTNMYELDKAIQEYKSGNEAPLRKILIPAEIISKVLQVVQIKKEAIRKLYTGSPLFKEFLVNENEKLPKEGIIALFYQEKFIETAKISKEKNIIARPEFVMN